MGIFKKIKKAFKKATSFLNPKKAFNETRKSANKLSQKTIAKGPKFMRRVGKRISDQMYEPEKEFKRQKMDIRSVGKKLKPKMPEQTKAPVIQQADEERTKQRAKSRTAARRGARSSSMLSDNLGG